MKYEDFEILVQFTISVIIVIFALAAIFVAALNVI